jgi:hypothetical protein
MPRDPLKVNVETGDLSKHTRSPESLKRREQRMGAKQFMWQNSYQDQIQAETVNLVDSHIILSFLGHKFGEIMPSAIPSAAFKGCVLSDSRGNGDFQKVKCPHSEAINCIDFPNCKKCSMFLKYLGGGKGN